MLSCSQDKVKFENVEVEIKGNHCIGTFDTPYLFKVTFDADIDLPVLPEYRSIPVRKVSLTIGEIKRLISICSDSNSVDLFGQWDLSKQELMAMLKQAEPYMGTEKVSPDYIAWLKNSIDSASEIPIRRQINLNDIPSGIPVIVYGKDNSNNPPSLLYFVIDGDFLFWYQRKEFIEIIPESMTAKHQYDPNYETEEQFIRKKPDAPSISQDNAYAIAIKYLDAIGADLNLYSVEKCSFLSNSAVDKETGWMFVFARKIFSIQTRYEVPSIVADTLYRIYGEHLNENGIGFAFEVTDMKLGMSLVSSDGKESGARLIPSWYIYYHKRWCDAEEYMVPNKLILSAIDGSYIEPRITTNDIR